MANALTVPWQCGCFLSYLAPQLYYYYFYYYYYYYNYYYYYYYYNYFFAIISTCDAMRPEHEQETVTMTL